jgi:2-oxoglutarate ferredoxin oxidoreductase subunit alpha
MRCERADKVGDRSSSTATAPRAGLRLWRRHGGAWYPITPSSSVAEAFQKYCDKFRVDPETGKHNYAIVQAEDELASIGMVVGAGWNGARAFTATSGPGRLADDRVHRPGLLCRDPGHHHQRAARRPVHRHADPHAAGRPAACAYASHGDTKHVLLFPEDPHECFEHAAPRWTWPTGCRRRCS